MDWWSEHSQRKNRIFENTVGKFDLNRISKIDESISVLVVDAVYTDVFLACFVLSSSMEKNIAIVDVYT